MFEHPKLLGCNNCIEVFMKIKLVQHFFPRKAHAAIIRAQKSPCNDTLGGVGGGE